MCALPFIRAAFADTLPFKRATSNDHRPIKVRILALFLSSARTVACTNVVNMLISTIRIN